MANVRTNEAETTEELRARMRQIAIGIGKLREMQLDLGKDSTEASLPVYRIIGEEAEQLR